MQDLASQTSIKASIGNSQLPRRSALCALWMLLAVHSSACSSWHLSKQNLVAAGAVGLQIRAELAEKELILLQKEQELLDKDQTLLVLKEEV
jgi:hypothetical protein